MLSTTLACNVSAQTPSDQDDDVVRVDTDLTNLFFIATNKQKAFVTTLLESDLRITEDGVPQKILTFQRETDRPLAIAFLIDISISEERTLPQEKAAARFLKRHIDEKVKLPLTALWKSATNFVVDIEDDDIVVKPVSGTNASLN